MIKLVVSESAEKLRAEFKSWLTSNPPPRVKSDSELESFIKTGREWQAKLSAANWVGVHWPKEYGGRGLSLIEEAVIQEELVRVNAPQLLGLFGLTMVGPVLISHGNEQQKKRFLSKILAAEEIWCQGFSETGAGSDLAALKTRATPTEGGFLLSGAKVWTSFAQVADWCFVLCRSSDPANKYDGFSYLLVDMKSKGITVRPLKQITGDSEFNEVFFENVFVPDSMLVGKEGDGWKIAISTLMFERVVLTFARHLQSEVLLRNLIKEKVFKEDKLLQRKLASEISSFCAVRALAYDHLAEYAAGKKPGPEGSLDKLAWTESFQSLCKLAIEANPEPYLNETESADAHRYLYSRGRTIAAGTSEIQKNIIAERILGLPRLKVAS